MLTAKIIFSDVDLTNKNINDSMRRILDSGLTPLAQELTSIGFCELGHAIITKGDSKGIAHNIFVPIVNSKNPQEKMGLALFHQAVRAALTLAKIYSVRDIVAELPAWHEEKTIYNMPTLGISVKKAVPPPLDVSTIKSVINSVLKEYPGILVKPDYLPSI